MKENDLSRAPRRHIGTPLLIVALGVVAAANAAAWFHFRKAQPRVDAQTRDRLRPRGGPGTGARLGA